MALPPVFMCYPRASDSDGRISRMRRALEQEVRLLTRDEQFRIFQDVMLEPGDELQRRVRDELERATVLLPIVQPLLFTSEHCRAELAAFLAHEKSRGRDDLVFPIYYLDCEDFGPHSQDPLRRALALRQVEDCRRLRLASDDEFDRAMPALARRLVEMFRRAQKPSPAGRTRGNTSSAVDPAARLSHSPRRSEQLRVLLLAADPRDNDELRLDREYRIVKDALRHSPAARWVRVERDFSSKRAELVDRLLEFSPDVLHFAGHCDEHTGPRLLARDGNSAHHRAQIQHVLRNDSRVRLLVLSACYSSRVAHDLAASLATVVVGTHGPVDDASAARFVEGLYRGIARRNDLRAAFDLARAALRVSEADADFACIAPPRNLDPAGVVLLPREPAVARGGGDARADAAAVRGNDLGALSRKQRDALIRMLTSLFSSAEFLRFLRFDAGTAKLLQFLSEDGVAPVHMFTEAVERLASSELLDEHFFRRLIDERPFRQPDIRRAQAELHGKR